MDQAAADRVKQIREYLSKMTPGPWLVRPLQFDDWGTIRCAENAHIVALARNGGIDYDAVAHRTNKTDPFSDNAEGIAKLRTDAEWLLSQLSASEERVRGLTELLRQSIAYFNGYVQDEAVEEEICVDHEHHIAAQKFKQALKEAESLLTDPPQVDIRG